MAVIFADGFDWYATADLFKRWTNWTVSANWSISQAYSRTGTGQGLAVSTQNTALYKSFGADYTSGVVGVAVYLSSVASMQFFTIYDGTSEQISIRTNASSVPIISRAGTTLATGSTVLSTSTWYYFELKFTINNTTGSVELRLNGASEIASTGSLDTQATGNTRFNGIALNRPNAGNQQFDDIYVLDTTTGSNTDFLGPVVVTVLSPSANGNSSSWTPSGGSNVGSVSEPFQDGNGTFIQSSTAGQIDTYVMDDLPAASGSVYALLQHTVAAQDGGAARTIAPVYRIGSTDYVGTSVATSSSYQFLTEISDTSPATASAWTVSEVNGLESGVKLIS